MNPIIAPAQTKVCQSGVSDEENARAGATTHNLGLEVSVSGVRDVGSDHGKEPVLCASTGSALPSSSSIPGDPWSTQ